ncbi:MAG: hypothetical protein JO316_17210 [Abitibacteriaceae bacterium]|nr:hypothetical protein [Abditibacteriaceae bacterium]MBV9867096.1 hypothetical protein [Abditibacteriaceae bacterium]
MQRLHAGMGVTLVGLILACNTIASAQITDPPPPTVLSPAGNADNVAHNIRLAIEHDRQRREERCHAEFGDWTYPGSDVHLLTPGPSLNPNFWATSSDSPGKVWAYYLDRLPKMKIQYPGHETPALLEQPNSLQLPWGKIGMFYDGTDIHISMPTERSNNGITSHYGTIMYKEKDDILFVTVADALPLEGGNQWASIEVLKVKTAAPTLQTAR